MVARGLPNAAIRLLEPLVKDAPDLAEDGVIELLVESYLAANQPARALDLLRAAATDSAVTKPDRNLLAARALAAMERFAEAAGILHGAPGEQVTQADYLWKAGLWQEATTAYRELLRDPAQDQANSEHAVRLAAAAYMADLPDRLEGSSGLAGTSALEAFAPLPAPGLAAGRTAATRLLDQATSLSQLAERHGLGGAKVP
jgi:hypothetical protein